MRAGLFSESDGQRSTVHRSWKRIAKFVRRYFAFALLILCVLLAAAGFLAHWWIDVALAVHFYETVLATLAIIVWHFYHVIFDPDVYPVNFAFIDGRVSEELYKEEHELAFEQIKEETRSEESRPPQTAETPDTTK